MKLILENFHAAMSESKQAHAAAVNEILFAYVASDFTFGGPFVNGADAKEVLDGYTGKVSDAEYEDQLQRAVKSFEAAWDWAAENGWGGKIRRVWWTARPNILSQASRLDLGGGEFQEASEGNPTDVLLQFEGGEFLGISLKSMKPLKGDIAFKNPGVGTVGKSLGVDLKKIIVNMDNNAEQKILDAVAEEMKKAGIKNTQKERKKWLKTEGNEIFREETIRVGKLMLTELRNGLINHLNAMSQDDIRDHILGLWLDAGALYPYYIKVTGRGTATKGYNASAVDPNNNEAYKALVGGEPITFVKTAARAEGDPEASIGVKAGNKRIMKMRFKFESEKLASSLKMSGDSW